MAESTLTTKGQCVIPKKIRDHMHFNPGDKIDFVIKEDGAVFVRPVVLDVRELKGLMKKSGLNPYLLKKWIKLFENAPGNIDDRIGHKYSGSISNSG